MEMNWNNYSEVVPLTDDSYREKYIDILSKAAKAAKEFNEDTPIKISLECIEDILELLKEQEAVEPIKPIDKDDDHTFMCSNCKGELFCGDVLRDNFCPTCGRRVKWGMKWEKYEKQMPIKTEEWHTVDFAPQGWQCPICKRVYSPMTPMCYFCGGKTETWSTSTNEDIETARNTALWSLNEDGKVTVDKTLDSKDFEG